MPESVIGGSMRKIFGWLVFFCAVTAVASDIPQYYPPLKGVVVSGLLERLSFEFSPGTLSDCTKNDAGLLIAYSCAVAGNVVKVSSATGKALQVSFDKVWVAYTQHSGGAYREYRFKGTYREPGSPVSLSSDVELRLWNYFNSPDDIRGGISLPGYGASGGIQASPQP